MKRGKLSLNYVSFLKFLHLFYEIKKMVYFVEIENIILSRVYAVSWREIKMSACN